VIAEIQRELQRRDQLGVGDLPMPHGLLATD
jgi:hypothetical protein